MKVKKFETCRISKKKICFQNITLRTTLLRGDDTFCFLPAFSKRMILK